MNINPQQEHVIQITNSTQKIQDQLEYLKLEPLKQYEKSINDQKNSQIQTNQPIDFQLSQKKKSSIITLQKNNQEYTIQNNNLKQIEEQKYFFKNNIKKNKNKKVNLRIWFISSKNSLGNKKKRKTQRHNIIL
ncbi:hypothetical protein IMG5_016410 [Ichthyophthirius multifiliis]|uniref:Uncharacterized protein n=1 Tax=Ichthyophthirius multifiliis TaxID=5932 RepID=G0QKD7_ICHMU|nr:hypothetical protein IMG5_016410 [Ichthyophthirius multifiliis]EGR34325.1 hypothetical protein IMG5_016410 [Ichthyophthirius multifiliis]|eukprot:XP_004039629.1 hypothetical protein IMG5_016410 [Ichthyophthirius multifiliis]